MTTHFKDHKEKITCTGGSLDGRELWIAAGLGSFTVLGHSGERETFVRDAGTTLFRCPGERRTVEMPCSQ